MTELPFGTYVKDTHWKMHFQKIAGNKSLPGWLRRYLKSYPASIVADVELDGVKFRCFPGQNHHDKLIFLGTLFSLEREEFEFMTTKVKSAEYVVDIGANTGTICIPLSFKMPSLKRILAIEPDPLTLQRLRFNLAINGISNISVVPCAVADREGVTRLWRSRKENLGQNSLLDPKRDSKHYVDIETKTLTSILAEHDVPRIDILKIDVEGFEDRALMPFFRSSTRAVWPKAVVIEHKSQGEWAEDCMAFMIENGYSLDGKNGQNSFLSLSDA
ncbi:FkbM family methyltransferase [Rhodomicrobium sp. Az07]|uniref:FkbM family methyltransferase n=1 Tax=Rhodomicrobium sp. Az07 TaxID=2839034 RepID=UPI001BE81B94|nr:FkbM family methyltransferase [Rhodomicrobium sp. Az07]MBT3069803.1 FkbM family methyltransferase [Rhodomicrobium sp. Az07]